MTSGLALVAAETRSRLFTIRGLIHDALRTDGSATDPEATKLCAALSHVNSAIEILQQQTGEAQSSSAGDEA